MASRTKTVTAEENQEPQTQAPSAPETGENQSQAPSAPVTGENQSQAPGTPEAVENQTQESPAPVEEKVEIFVPRGNANDDPNLLVGINGVNYLLPRGKASLVPKAVATEIRLSLRAQQIQDENIDKMLSKK